MATYIGFNTQHVNEVRQTIDSTNTGVAGSIPLNSPMKSKNKFRTLDEELVIQDFINALNIQQGSKPGNPGYGTSLWSFVFEPNTTETRVVLEEEIMRVASFDPRIAVSITGVVSRENGISMTIDMYVLPFNNPISLSILFDQNSSMAIGS